MTAVYQTIEEIERQFPNEWVVIDKPTVNATQRVLGGYVVYHTPDRAELDARLGDFEWITSGALLYTGEPDPDEIWLLNL